MLEWTDDLELFIVKGYGNKLNYRMGVPLLEDVLQSMEQAIKAKEGNIFHEKLISCPFILETYECVAFSPSGKDF